MNCIVESVTNILYLSITRKSICLEDNIYKLSPVSIRTVPGYNATFC